MLRPACEALADELGIRSRVSFLGQRDDVARLMNCFDALVMPSQSEGLPLVAIEALAGGVPPVGFDVGGMREVVNHGVTGLLVPGGDFNALTDAVARLAEDASLRGRMSAAAVADAERFDVRRHVEGLQACYERLLAPAAALAATQ